MFNINQLKKDGYTIKKNFIPKKYLKKFKRDIKNITNNLSSAYKIKINKKNLTFEYLYSKSTKRDRLYKLMQVQPYLQQHL